MCGSDVRSVKLASLLLVARAGSVVTLSAKIASLLTLQVVDQTL